MPELLPHTPPLTKTQLAKTHAQPLYSVYVYYYVADIEAGQADWEKKAELSCPRLAVRKAEHLFRAQRYKKIEIKKRVFDTHHGMFFDKTLKVIEPRKHKNSLTSQWMRLISQLMF